MGRGELTEEVGAAVRGWGVVAGMWWLGCGGWGVVAGGWFTLRRALVQRWGENGAVGVKLVGQLAAERRGTSSGRWSGR